MKPHLKVATPQSLDELLPLVRLYHLFEEIELSDEEREKALIPLLGNSHIGRIWMVEYDGMAIGYIILCFCYSIEHGGMEAFVDEFFIGESYRGRGIGKEMLGLALLEAKDLNIKAISLEVGNSNLPAKKLYKSMGFHPRDKYSLYTYFTGA